MSNSSSSSDSSESSCQIKVLDCKPICCNTGTNCQPCVSKRACVIECNSSSSSDSCSGVSSSSLCGDKSVSHKKHSEEESCTDKKEKHSGKKEKHSDKKGKHSSHKKEKDSCTEKHSDGKESCTDKFSESKVSCDGKGCKKKKYRFVECKKVYKPSCDECQGSFSSSSSGSCRAPKLPRVHSSHKSKETHRSHQKHSNGSHESSDCHHSNDSFSDHSERSGGSSKGKSYHDSTHKSYQDSTHKSYHDSTHKSYRDSTHKSYHDSTYKSDKKSYQDHGTRKSDENGKKESHESDRKGSHESDKNHSEMSWKDGGFLESSGSSWLGFRKEKKSEFQVNLTDKKNHPWSHRIVGSSHAFTVGNGKKSHPGGIIHLYQGKKYVFNVKQKGDRYPLYFTTDPIGGPRGEWTDSTHYSPDKIPGTPDPVTNGRMVLNVNQSLPRAFYYQCVSHPCMGGLVVVHRRK